MAAREVVTGIWEIDTQPLGQERLVASYVVLGRSAVALIDPGFPCSAQAVEEGLGEAGVKPSDLTHIVLTHSHIDHAGSVGHFARAAPKARVVAHFRGAFYLRNAVKIAGGSSMVFGIGLAEQLGAPIDVPGDRIAAQGDGECLDLGGRSLQAFHTPGHCGDHISWLDQSTGTLFSGDTACLHYPDLAHALIPAGSPPIYRTDFVEEELDRLMGQGVRVVLTPHFGQPAVGAADFLAQNRLRVREVRQTIDRLFRQGLEFSQVVETLRGDILASAAGAPLASEFLRDTWLRLMLRTGLMGYMADILQYARDLRPFLVDADLERA